MLHVGLLVAPLAAEFVQRMGAAYPQYQRLVSYWHHVAPVLAGALAAALQEAGDAVTRQCGLGPAPERANSSRGSSPTRESRHGGGGEGTGAQDSTEKRSSAMGSLLRLSRPRATQGLPQRAPRSKCAQSSSACGHPHLSKHVTGHLKAEAGVLFLVDNLAGAKGRESEVTDMLVVTSQIAHKALVMAVTASQGLRQHHPRRHRAA